MPKKLNVHPNERVDLPDFNHAANDYSFESDSFAQERITLDKRSRVLEGFRIQIDDQTATPGQITVYNGNALDRDGAHLNEEALAATQLTVTLTGATTTFYVEIERVESDSDVDSRGFWDPSFDNGGAPTPDGQEFPLNVSTRKTPTWRIVQPVSTTGFQSTTNPNSTRIPLAILSTDGSNEITAAATSGLVVVQPSTVLENDTASGVSQIRVLDARLFSIGDTITVGFGGSSPDAGLVISSIDTDNGLITFAPVTSNSHLAGAIVRRTSGTARLMEEQVDPNASAAHPDYTPRLWQGDEIRGSGVLQSKETFGDRDDLNIRNLKDHIDFLAAQIRDLKYGSPRTDESTANTPPVSFATNPRYFESVGGVAGARSNVVSIGDGTNSFGDFNGTDETPFVAAVAALATFTPTGGKIVIKNGTYTFTSTVTLDDDIELIGMGRDSTVIVNNVAAGSAFEIDATSSDIIGMRHLRVENGTGSANVIDLAGPGRLHISDCTFTGGFTRSGSGDDNRVYARDSNWSASDTVLGDAGGGDTFANCVFERCSFTALAVLAGGSSFCEFINCRASVGNFALVSQSSTGLTITGCTMAIGDTLVETSAVIDQLRVSDNYIASTLIATEPVLFNTSTLTHSDHRWERNRVVAAISGTTEGAPGYVLYYDSDISDLHITDNSVEVTTAGAFVEFFAATNGALSDVNINGNEFNDSFRFFHMLTGTVTNLLIRGNLVTTPSLTTTVVCSHVQFDGAVSGVSRVKIYENVFETASGSGPKHGIYFVSTSASNFEVLGNSIDINSSNNSARAIYISGSSAHTFVVSDNTIDAAGDAAGAIGIYVTGSGTIVGNNLREISSTAAGLTVTAGIYTLGGGSLTISSNHVASVATTSTGLTRGIHLEGTIHSTVSGNTVDTVSAGAFNTNCTGIYASDFENNSITGNTVDARGANHYAGIHLEVVGAGTYSGTVSGNTVLGGSDCVYPLLVSAPGTGDVVGLLIASNQLTLNCTASLSNTGIRLALNGGGDRAIAVTGNTVHEVTYNADNIAFTLDAIGSGDCSAVTVTGNVFFGDVPNASARNNDAFTLEGVQDFVVGDNVLFWDDPASGAATQNVMNLTTCSVGIIKGNKIQPSNGGNEIDVSVGCSDILIHANYVGDGTTAGNVNAGASTGITDSDNKLT